MKTKNPLTQTEVRKKEPFTDYVHVFKYLEIWKIISDNDIIKVIWNNTNYTIIYSDRKGKTYIHRNLIIIFLFQHNCSSEFRCHKLRLFGVPFFD